MAAFTNSSFTIGGSSVRNFVAGLVDSFRKAAAERRSYDAIMSELTRLDDREMRGMGISRADFDAIAAGTFNRQLSR
jgi:uncharacterized protein YjiS (DUF1127 family)